MRILVIGGGPAGLYFSLLLKKARPDAAITVIERNPANVTWGWGVVFSDETLEHFREADPQTHDAIAASFARWESIDIHFQGRIIRSSGHAFCGLRRMRLLEILQERCAALGVDLRFGQEVDDPATAMAEPPDLIVAADGVNSRVRSAMADAFRPDIAVGASPYVWLATPRVFDAFTFIVRENEHGLFQVHAYPFDRETSTFIVETDQGTLQRAGLDRATEADSVAYCERLFAPELQGRPLLSNKSAWIQFRRVKCATWRHGNVVLLGDAAHTAHFSIGSGTKMAMEDAIALARHLAAWDARKGGARGADPAGLDSALAAYQEERWVDVAKRQRVAEVSQRWFEGIARYARFDPEQFAVSLLTRSKKVTHGNLKRRDPAYIESVDRWFAARCGLPEPASGAVTPPMFTPLRLRGLEIPNRVAVSPMCMYSAADGTPNDWHMVHLGSRAVGGAGLVMTEMTDVSSDGRITPGCAGMYKPEHVQAWRRIVQFIHANTPARVGMQLAHAGRKGSVRAPWEGTDEPLPSGNWALIAPSALAWAQRNQIPRAMDRDDMRRVREDFARSARLAAEAEFDLLELHCAHGYLLATYLSPLTNRRTDAYGGSLENRMRFPLEVFDAVREVWPVDRPMSVRLSATDWVEGGMEVDDAVEAGRLLKAHGCDIIDVSSGWTTPESIPVFGAMYQMPFADRVRNEAGIPTITVGNIQSWDQVNTIVVAGHADLCMLARPHLIDPYFTIRAAIEQQYDIHWPDQYLPARPRR